MSLGLDRPERLALVAHRDPTESHSNDMHPLVKTFLLGAAIVLTSGSLASGCAQSSDPQDDDGSTTSTGASGATTGSGTTGAGGSGVGGSTGLCAIDCEAIATPTCLRSVCNDGSYAGAVGECVVINDDGAACDDGAFCTVDDTCQGGTCVGGPANDCGMTAPECQEVVCNDDTDSCALAAMGEGDPCVSTDLCLTGTTCTGGSCGGGTPKDCFLAPVPNECHVSQCNPNNGMCEAVAGNDGATCVDELDACQVNGTCSAGVCTGTTLKDCSHLDAGCNVGVCNSMNAGACEPMTVAQGQACSDGDACTMGEVCDANAMCTGGSPVTTCSPTLDGCCPGNCNETNDADCACPGSLIGNTCVYVPSTSNNVTTQAAAQSACQALGTGWDLCTSAAACDQAVYQYLASAGCDCGGGPGACACGSAANLYVYLSGSTSPHYIRDPAIPNCISGSSCTTSVSQMCGVPVCCK